MVTLPGTAVFVCECGGKIAQRLDLAELTRSLAGPPAGFRVERAPYWCLPGAVERLRSVVQAEHVERVLIAGCSPRTFNPFFRRALGGRIDAAYIETFNLRDLFARSTPDDGPSNPVRARAQIAIAVAELENRIAGMRITPIAQHAAVVGGGVAGLTAALGIARAGIPVTLVERASDLGGAASAQVSDLVSSVCAHAAIQVQTSVEAIRACGTVGQYKVDLSNGVTITAGAIVLATGMPPNGVPLAQSLRMSVDSAGYLADVRQRLRPADRIERGIYVCGAAHRACDADTAAFEGSIAAANAIRHIRRGSVSSSAPGTSIDTKRCNGCGDCARVCPFSAVSFTDRPEFPQLGKLACVDPFLCTGCGNCVSVCPVDAVHIASEARDPVLTQMQAALDCADSAPPAFMLACEWSGYSAAEIAGARGFALPAATRLIRINCTGRLAPGLLLRTLEMGAAGVLVLGCAPGNCHYERGNEHAAQIYEQVSALAHLMDMNKRLALEWVPPDDGAAFARVVSNFAERVANAD